ncbi:protein kinase family protein [Legionella longbeachae]|uniref:hypothetical protein n=1 Tax=Legionella longbeachae TaxID=450 RepID=UPI001248A211|nr:hypothetical protein [Legionella longbeachae]QEY52029.1 hypothetical protein FQU71_12775 [Legionella longbeachae]
MKELALLSQDEYKGDKFIQSVNKDIKKLNSLVREYNNAPSIEKNEILIEIYYYQKDITDKYPASYNLSYPNFYQSFQIELFNEMKKEFSIFGIYSISKDAVNEFDLNNTTKIAIINQNNDIQLQKFWNAINLTDDPEKLFYLKQKIRNIIVEEHLNLERKKEFREIVASINEKLANLPSVTHDDPFIEWIANMDANQVTRLIEVLRDNNGLPKEARDKLSCPEGYGITFLGGTNSRNFAVKNPFGEVFILKVDNRFDAPKDMEQQLSEHPSLRHTVMPALVDRVAVVDYGLTKQGIPLISSGLVITEFCSGGDVFAYRETVARSSDDLLNSAAHIFKQMVEILITMKKIGAVFSDAKNTNWLIDNKLTENLKIADSKSLRPAASSDWYPFLVTAGMQGDSAFIVANNIYQYLTGCDLSALEHKDFNQPIFHTEKGQKFGELIHRLSNSNQPISLEEVLLELTDLDEEVDDTDANTQEEIYQSALKECLTLVDKIRQHPISNNDTQITDFIKYITICIDVSDKAQLLNSIKQELETVLLGQEMMQKIKNEINKLRDEGKNEFFSINKGAKADRIETALNNVLNTVPVQKRHLIMDSQEGKRVQDALASSRTLPGKVKHFIYSGENNKGAASFSRIKKELNDMKKENENRELQNNMGPK